MASNDYSDKYNNIKMTELNFMPFFEIRLINDIDEKYDIFTS